MLGYDQGPARQKDLIAQRQAMLDTIIDYRFLTPHKIAADERWERERAHVALTRSALPPIVTPSRLLVAARLRLGEALIAAGVRLRGRAAGELDPQPGA